MSLSLNLSHAAARKMLCFSKHRSNAFLRSTLSQQNRSVLFHSSRQALKPNKPKPKLRRKREPPKKKKPSHASPSAIAKQKPQKKDPLNVEDIDPQQLASEFVQFSAARKQGSESIQELTQTQKLQNYGLALSLMGFVGWVWYYSMTSVGRSEGGMEQLLSEAEGARDAKEKKSIAEKEVGELLKAEMSLGSLDAADEAMGGKGLVVAVAAPDDIARREEERNLEVAGNGKGGKPMWKRVVFFWRRD